MEAMVGRCQAAGGVSRLQKLTSGAWQLAGHSSEGPEARGHWPRLY